MTNTPKSVYMNDIRQLHSTLQCNERLAGAPEKVIDAGTIAHKEFGAIEFRFVERTSVDGTCIVQEDVFTYEDGREVRRIVTIEVDRQVYYAQYEGPVPLG